jgi:hypothetical protein
MSSLASSADIDLIRQVTAQLTREPAQRYLPGKARKPYRCQYCLKIFTSQGLRGHVPRCKARSQGKPKTWNERMLGGIPVSPAELAQLYQIDEWLSSGPQGAD